MFFRTKLIIFDVDGVLLDNKLGAMKEILIGLGQEDEVKKIDAEYQVRKKAGPWGLAESVDLYKDFELSVLKHSAQSYCQEKMMLGAKETVAEIRFRKIKVGAVSSNPMFVMQTLKEILGLDFATGLEMEFIGKVATGGINRIVDRFEKAKIVKAKLIEFKIKPEEAVVVGDSITDLPMAAEVGKFIAFNAKPEAVEKANVVITKKDLRKILNYI